jgi:hypothetical protein
MKITLVNILWKKELVHWKRLKQMFTRFNSFMSKITFGFIVAILITIAHYCFAIMHTLYEIFLWIFVRDIFKENLQKISLKMGLV